MARGTTSEVAGGIGVLIGIYLVLKYGANATRIAYAIADGGKSWIKTLQGR